jgi:hypothetical protein
MLRRSSLDVSTWIPSIQWDHSRTDFILYNRWQPYGDWRDVGGSCSMSVSLPE